MDVTAGFVDGLRDPRFDFAVVRRAVNPVHAHRKSALERLDGLASRKQLELRGAKADDAELDVGSTDAAALHHWRQFRRAAKNSAKSGWLLARNEQRRHMSGGSLVRIRRLSSLNAGPSQTCSNEASGPRTP